MHIYLYKKTHNQTGLQYLGKTTAKDPHKYQGSGKAWKPHIKEHGYDVTTEIIRECKTQVELSYWGRYYSELWNIVESDEWANKIPETGGGGGDHISASTTNANLKRVAAGTHNFLGDNNPSHTRVAEGTHNFQGDSNPSKRKITSGVHHWLGPECNAKRIENGTHNFLGDNNPSHTRVASGTHNWQQPVDENHPTQFKWICPHCNRKGKGKSMFNRWHGNNCRSLL